MNLHEANMTLLYMGLVTFFIFEVLVFITVRAWSMVGGVLVYSRWKKSKKVPKKNDDTIYSDNYDRVILAMWVAVFVTIISFIVLYFFKDNLLSNGLYRLHDVNNYIGFQGTRSYGIELHGAG